MPRTWLITGSSRGFDWELAKAVLAKGDRLVTTARRPNNSPTWSATTATRSARSPST